MQEQEHPHVPSPQRHQIDEATRFMRLSQDELRADFYWRYARAVENFWRVRARQLRPPLSVRLRITLVPVVRWCLRASRAGRDS
jgi:hypothetical protein